MRFVAACTEAASGGTIESDATAFRTWVRTLFTDLARQAEAADPDLLGRQLHLLYDGAALSARMDHDPGIATASRRVVEVLLGAAFGANRPREDGLIAANPILTPSGLGSQRIPFGIAYRSECYKVPAVPRGITKRRPITVTALLDAAMELFAEQGFGATSIPDICTRAGLTKGAFYSNFANKDALFLALLDRSWARRAEWIRRAMPAGDGLAAGEPGDRPRWRTSTSTGNGRSCPWSSPCTRSVIRRWRGSSSITSCACDRSSQSS